LEQGESSKVLPMISQGKVRKGARDGGWRTNSEHAKIAFPMARPPDREKAEILSEKDLKELRYSLGHLSVTAVRDLYQQAYQDCRLVYDRLPSPRKMQTLVQAWKQLRKWR
jgi:hypothetical protein